MAKIDKIARQFCFTHKNKFRIEDVDPGDTGSISSEEEAQDLLKSGLRDLQDRQEKLYAQQEWAVLLVLQGMDAAGKDSVVKHVMSGVNPAGCEVISFKQPSEEELRHDFLWREVRRLPERGKIGIFNRSYYEEVLVVRVHHELLDNEHLPPSLISKKIWGERFEDICAFEQHLARNGTVIRKFFLHVSKAEQKKRLLRRLETPGKRWKFSQQDVQERKLWPQYMEAYEDMIRATTAPHAPWYVIPADNKWFTQLVVASAVVNTLDELKLSFPKISRQKEKELIAVRKSLERSA
jgi:PPK2 family polyphosphate:nucleotide phosphotransferase